MSVKPFEQDPKTRYMKLTNYLFDCVMPAVKPNTWKVLCFIIRKTTGFNKPEDILSISQIMTGTGIKNRNTTTAAIDELETAGYVIVSRDGKEKHIDGNTYRLNLDFEVEPGSTEIVLPTRKGDTENVLPHRVGSTEIVLPQYENRTSQEPGSTEIVPEVVQKSYTQNNTLLNTNELPLEVEQQPQLSHARPAAAAVDPNDDHPDFPDDPKRDQQNQVVDLYRLSFLNPTQFIPPKMLEVLRKDALKYPLPWIERAVEKSITGGKDWRYVQGILKNWLAVGGPENDQKPGGQNGHQNGTGNDTGRNRAGKPETPSQAAQWEAENGERFRAAVARLTRC